MAVSSCDIAPPSVAAIGSTALPAALARAVGAAERACRGDAGAGPEGVRWRQHAPHLVASLRHAMAAAAPEVFEELAAQLDDIVDASGDDRELLRRLIVLASHAVNHQRLCDDPAVPAVVRRRGRALQFRLFDRLARVGRDPELERLARRRNEVLVGLGLRPRSLALLDWCDVAVRIAVGGPLRETLAALPAGEAARLLAAKVRFDLLAIELNIALDDLADDGREAGLFALTVERALGPGLARACFHEDTAVGRYFLDQRAQAEAVRGERGEASARYLALVEELYREVVAAGRALAGPRWDGAIWSAQMRRIVGAMMLSLVQNARPDLLDQVDWARDLGGPDRLAVQAANSNRVIFELVGLWCHERVSGRRVGAAAEPRLLAAFEDLQIAQQLCNCLATLDRELDEGDRSNCVVERAVEIWGGLSEVERAALVERSGLVPPLSALSVPASDRLVDALYQVLNRPGGSSDRAIAADCLRRLVDATGAVRDVFAQWALRVDAAAARLESAGCCGATSRQAQVDLLVLHLVLLKQSPAAPRGERL